MVIDDYFIFFQSEIEEWMRILASASFEMMKLMVMELQQKLAEVEEQEKLQIQQLQKPKETRTNPFDKADGTAKNLSASWAQIHARYGAKICSDRDQWCLRLIQS